MNIFEFINLSADHRKLSNKVTQLVKHFDEVPASRKKNKKFAVQTKMDGVCALAIVKNGKSKIFSRTGKKFVNTENIEARIDSLHLEDSVYMGELLVPKDVASLEEFSGCVNPNRNKPLCREFATIPDLMEMHFFDTISTKDFIMGESKLPFHERFKILDNAIINSEDVGLYTIEYSTLTTESQIDNALSSVVSEGGEGVIIRDIEADWEAGHKGWRVMKKVRDVDYDLRCIDVEEGTGKYKGKVANLIFGWKAGKTIKCMLGRGWSHSMAEEMWNNRHDPELSPIGKVFQVYALEESSKGKLRLPKVGEQRHDKNAADI